MPVCIGNLPLSTYVISYDALAEEGVNHLQANVLLPSAIVTQGSKRDHRTACAFTLQRISL